MGAHIRREGWNDWDKASVWHTVHYGEAGSEGPGAQADKRVGWSKQLRGSELERFTPEAVFGGDAGWIR
ncbi:Pectinesterase [compost metagenome]